MRGKTVISILAIVFYFSFVQTGFACRPAQNYRYPTLKENYENSQTVALVKVGKVRDLGPLKDKPGQKIEAEVTPIHTFKGKIDEKVAVVFSANTCDALGYNLSPDLICLFFFSSANQVASSVFSGTASVCTATADKKEIRAFISDWKKSLAGL